jgi:hypothetical protein
MMATMSIGAVNYEWFVILHVVFAEVTVVAGARLFHTLDVRKLLESLHA